MSALRVKLKSGNTEAEYDLATDSVEVTFKDCDEREYKLVVGQTEDTLENWTNGAVAIDLTYPDGGVLRMEEVGQ